MSGANNPEVIPQVCTIPFRRQGAELRFCVITSLKKKRWIFPKGIIDPGETAVESALKEAYEEAGLRGRILDRELGSFDDSKWQAQLTVKVVMMEVTEIAATWPESELRQRQWVSSEAGIHLLHRAELQEFLRQAAELLMN